MTAQGVSATERSFIAVPKRRGHTTQGNTGKDQGGQQVEGVRGGGGPEPVVWGQVGNFEQVSDWLV